MRNWRKCASSSRSRYPPVEQNKLLVYGCRCPNLLLLSHQISIIQVRDDLCWESPLRAIVRFAEGRESWILGASAEVLALCHTHIVHPVSRMASVQTALPIPRSLDAMRLAVPEMTFPPDAFLIFVQPPLETVASSVFEIASFGQIRQSVFETLTPPEINARTAPHGVGSNQLAVLEPLPGCSVWQPIGIGLSGIQLSRSIRAVHDSVCHPILERALVFQLACFMEEPNSDDLSIQYALRLVFLRTRDKGSGNPLSRSFRNR